MKDTMIGVDLAKSVFQLHGASLAGHLKFRKKVTRGSVLNSVYLARPMRVSDTVTH